MRVNIRKSKLAVRAMEMPVLKHKVEITEGGQVRDSEVLRWIAQNEDLVMWAFCLLRRSGLIIRSECNNYVGNKEWNGMHPKDLKPFKGGPKVLVVGKKGKKFWKQPGGRSATFGISNLLEIMELCEQPVAPGEICRVARTRIGMSRAVVYRLIKRALNNFMISKHRDGYSVNPKPSTPSTSILPPTTTESPALEPLS